MISTKWGHLFRSLSFTTWVIKLGWLSWATEGLLNLIYSCMSDILYNHIHYKYANFFLECVCVWGRGGGGGRVAPYQPISSVDLHPDNLQLHCFLGLWMLLCCSFFSSLNQPCKMVLVAPFSKITPGFVYMYSTIHGCVKP